MMNPDITSESTAQLSGLKFQVSGSPSQANRSL
jgi:hypothetical protein